MPDVFTKEKRSTIMSKIQSKGTGIERKMMKALEDGRIEFQYQPKMYGKPDFLVYPNIAVFCDSSFWHGRNWSRLREKLPNEYWRNHIRNNRERDKKISSFLTKSGFTVLRFWDKDIERNTGCCVERIQEAINHNSKTLKKH